MVTGQQLAPTLRDVRPGLDVVTGGVHLADVAGALAARASRGDSTTDLLARALAPLATKYDLVVVDTPPVDTTLQALALNASRWLLIPTKADASSIRGIQRIAERVADARQAGHEIDILGVVLAGVPTAARRVRAGAIADITAVLGDSASLLDAVVRSSDAVARECRTKGILAHELAEELEGAEPFWRALREGSTPQHGCPVARQHSPTTTSGSRNRSCSDSATSRPRRGRHDRLTVQLDRSDSRPPGPAAHRSTTTARHRLSRRQRNRAPSPASRTPLSPAGRANGRWTGSKNRCQLLALVRRRHLGRPVGPAASCSVSTPNCIGRWGSGRRRTAPATDSSCSTPLRPSMARAGCRSC